MTLADRIKLVNDMVRENPDVTIKDYLELVNDVTRIEHAAEETPIIIPEVKEPEPEEEIRAKKINRMVSKYLQTYKAHW